MKKWLPVLLLCALMLLSACGKKQAEPAGSISSEETAETQTQKNTKKTNKTAKSTKATASPKATATPTGGKSSGGKTLLSVRNPYKDKPILVDGMPISPEAGKGHGYGSASICYMTERLGGNCQFVLEENQFVVRVII